MLQNDASLFAYSLAIHEVVTVPTIPTVPAATPNTRAPSPPVDMVNAVAATPTPYLLQMRTTNKVSG